MALDWIELLPSKLDVAGSDPAGRDIVLSGAKNDAPLTHSDAPLPHRPPAESSTEKPESRSHEADQGVRFPPVPSHV
jgi:hypothetical protein